MNLKDRVRKTRAFSLVEVAFALGIVSFGIIVVVGLLPGGLNAVRASRESAAATKCIEGLSESIRGACLVNGSYKALGCYSDMTWRLGVPAFTYTKNNLNLGGAPTATAADQHQTCAVVMQPPADSHSTGTALISVAWPSRATWNADTLAWSNAQGSLSTWIVFLPCP